MQIAHFTIPAIPPSLNSIYKVNYIRREVYLAQTAKDFKHLAKLYTPVLKYQPGMKLRFSIEYYGNWHNKDGTIKRKDGQNLDKCLYDAIFEKLGVDDKVVFVGNWKKIQSDKEKTVITINSIDCD